MAIKQPKIQNVDNSKPLNDMVNEYNKMYADPKEYAQTTYQKQINDLGRVDPRSARYKTVIPQDKGKIPN